MALYLIVRTKGREAGRGWAVVWFMLAVKPDALGPGTFRPRSALERDVVIGWEGVCNSPPNSTAPSLGTSGQVASFREPQCSQLSKYLEQ